MVRLRGFAFGLALGLVLLIPAPARAAFGLTTAIDYYQVDTGAGLIFKIRRTDNGSSTQSPGDIMSLLYRGTEYQDPSRGSQVNSGFDWIYSYTNLVSVSADVYGTNYIKITVVCGDPASGQGLLTHYYLARRGYPYIYMSTYFTKEPDVQSLCRYIVRIPSSLLPNGPAPSDIRGNTNAIESGDIFGMPDGTTRSKHYSNHRLLDWSYTGATSADAGVWMVRSTHEGDSGGPFYRCLINQCTSGDQEIYEMINYGEGQTEAFRTGILDGPYTLVFTDGGPPPVPLDYTWLQSAGLNLVGFVPDADRGKVSGTVLGIPSVFQAVVGLANSNAEYWAVVSSNGTYSSPLMIPGTYTASLYKQELVVATASVSVAAGTTNDLNLTSTEPAPSTVWRIGEWDGTPSGFLNADKMTYMHPSDVRMTPWGGSNVFNAGTDAVGVFPSILMRGTNSHTYIKFNLLASQLTNLTLRIGATTSYNGGRPDVQINGHDLGYPAAPSEPKTRAWTVGTYRGNNLLWTWTVPAADLIVGQNTFNISAVSGSTDLSPWLSAGWVYDCVELDGPPAPINPNAPALLTRYADGELTLCWPTNAGWTLQQQTSSRSAGLDTNWVDVPGSTRITATNVVVDPAQPAVFYRLRR